MNKTLITGLAGLALGASALYALTSLKVLPAWSDDDHGAEKDHRHHEDEGGDHHEEPEELELSEEAIRSAGIAVAAATAEAQFEGLALTAVVEANQDRLAHVGPRIEGSLVEIKKEAVLGGEVQAGQILAVLDGIELGKAKAAYLKQRAVLETAEDRVAKESALLTRLNRLEIGTEAIRFIESRQLLEVARRNYEREERLVKTQASSEKDLLAAQAQLLSGQAKLNAARDKLLLLGVDEEQLAGLTRKGARALSGVGTTSAREKLDAVVALKTAQAELQAACELLSTLGLTESDIASLGHDHARPISHFYVRAPIAGRIIEKHATMGEVVESRARLFVVADLSTVWVLLDVYERDIPRVALNQRARVSIPGLAEVLDGTVTYLGDVVDPETRTIKARVELANPGRRLKPGMFVRVKLVEASTGEAAVLVPAAAVQRHGSETVVFVRRAPGRFARREVSLGARAGSRVVILEGLEAGEDVVVEGGFWLKSQLSRSQLGGGHSH